MTQPGRYDLVLLQGSTFRLTFIWKIGDTPVNVSGFQARLQVRERIADATPVLAIADTGGITVGTTDGAFEIVITDEDTAALDFRTPAYYDFEVESPGGEVTRLLHGRAGLSREVTREAVLVGIGSGIDGGLPSSSYAGGLDGGVPDSTFDGTVDGGSY